MSGLSLHVEVDDSRVRAALQRLINFGSHPKEALKDIATLGEASTRERFDTQTGPDGQPWQPSIRALRTGGKTLTLDGHLRGSITRDSGDDFAQWGINRIYGAIHQFGGQAGRGLRSKIVARPYLGINTRDETGILNIILSRIQGAVDAG